MKIILAIALALPGAASAEPSRGLPTGETPSVIEQVYGSPDGDLEFLRRGDSHSVLLRDPKGTLVEMTQLRGPLACSEWFISEKSEKLPADCEFVFFRDHDGTYLSVKSEQMEESNLFRSVSGSLRGKNVSL